MSYNIPGTHKKCITCEYFSIDRDINLSGTVVESASGDAKGKCNHSTKRGWERKACEVCSHWRKWGAVK